MPSTQAHYYDTPQIQISFTMKPLLALLLTLLPFATADFELYHVVLSRTYYEQFEGWQVYPTETTCATALDWEWRMITDVSGDHGVRCEGNGCRTDQDDDIDVLEVNFARVDHHWSKVAAVYHSDM